MSFIESIKIVTNEITSVLTNKSYVYSDIRNVCWCFSEEAKNKFEFVIASSEYMFRKPKPILFELTLKKAGLCVEDVWFCGDNIKADVEGSAAVGIFPIWYENDTVENPRRGQNKGILPKCKYLHIHDWLELTDILEELG